MELLSKCAAATSSSISIGWIFGFFFDFEAFEAFEFEELSEEEIFSSN